MKSRRSRAFTLLELLAVISIVIILVAVLGGVSGHFIESARTIKCTGNLRQLGAAAHLYIADNNGVLPYTSASPNWMVHLAPYIGAKDGTLTKNDPPTDAFLCPSDPSRNPRQLRTYRYASSFGSPGGGYLSSYIPSRLSEIVRPATHAMFYCVAYTGTRQLELWTYDQAIWKETVDIANPPNQANDWPRPHYNNKGVNILYSDGHVAEALYPLAPATFHFDGR
jgi:prepilin-type processing-associated H-X9-DG protein